MMIYIRIIELFILLLSVYCLYAAIFPYQVIKFTLDKHRGMNRFYGFKGEISATGHSFKVIRNGHLFAFVFFALYLLIMIVVFK